MSPADSSSAASCLIPIPFAFRRTTAGTLSDSFVRRSLGITTGGVSSFNAEQVKPFYGDARAVAAPPPGFVQQSPSGGYVPAPLMSREPGDFRLGQINPVNTADIVLPHPATSFAGPVDPSTQNPTVITASPLYGITVECEKRHRRRLSRGAEHLRPDAAG